jgi:hypothetical protein
MSARLGNYWGFGVSKPTLFSVEVPAPYIYYPAVSSFGGHHPRDRHWLSYEKLCNLTDQYRLAKPRGLVNAVRGVVMLASGTSPTLRGSEM